MIAATRQTLLSWRALAAVSLCFNGFLLAYVGSQYVFHPRHPMAPPPPTAIIKRIAETLPDSDAHVLWQAYRSNEGKIAAAHEDYRHILTEVAGILRQPKVDESALKQAVLAARDKRAVVGDTMIEVFLDAFPKMSLAGREMMLEKTLH